MCLCADAALSTACCASSGMHDTIYGASNAADIVTERSSTCYTNCRPGTAAGQCKRRHTINYSRQHLANWPRIDAKRSTSEILEYF